MRRLRIKESDGCWSDEALRDNSSVPCGARSTRPVVAEGRGIAIAVFAEFKLKVGVRSFALYSRLAMLRTRLRDLRV